MVFYEHSLAVRSAVAPGWLARARRHLAAEPESVEHAYLALAEGSPTSRRWRWS
jgi:hypothetical protein